METILIIRKQYDRLIEAEPKFMRTEYLKLKRRWGLSGVFVSGDVTRIKAVMASLEAVTA